MSGKECNKPYRLERLVIFLRKTNPKNKRLLQQRIDEHIGISTRTKKPLLNPPNSAIRDHQKYCNSDLTIDNFEILDSVKYHSDLLILESIYINKNNPTLNDKQSAAKLYIL